MMREEMAQGLKSYLRGVGVFVAVVTLGLVIMPNDIVPLVVDMYSQLWPQYGWMTVLATALMAMWALVLPLLMFGGLVLVGKGLQLITTKNKRSEAS